MSTGPEPVLRDPVVIIGMHRSGTTMLARMLDDLGIFMGWRLQGDHEPLFFLELNDWLLTQSSCGWDNPTPIEWLVNHESARAAAVDYLRLSLNSPRAISFLGPWNTLRFGAPRRLAQPWGWKDPRTTFTLPLWLDLFPNARLVCVHRHGVDVAASLSVRHEEIVARRRARFERRRPFYWLVRRRSRITTSLRVATLEGGFSLWEEYVDAARSALAAHAGPTLEIRYEDFLTDPQDGLRRVMKFCDVPASEERLRAVGGDARPDRAFAYRRTPALQAFATANAERLAVRGY